MRFSPRTWSLLSLLLFVAAAFFWLKGNEYQAELKRKAPARPVTNAPATGLDLKSIKNSGASLARLSTVASAATPRTASAADLLFPHRLRNTGKTLNELMRDDHAILLANALIDTAGHPLDIPEALRSGGDPGSYIVQWNGAANSEFRQRLAEAGAEIISYVPNNAYYVKLDRAGADKLQATAGIQSVLPYEPYYKLEKTLLDLAVENRALPDEALLRLTLLPGAQRAASQDLAAAGIAILAQETSPFGPQFVVAPASDSLAALARMSSVQAIEPVTPRKLASDISRIVLGIATNGSTASNYLNLTGSNIVVNVNDTGLDTNNAGLKDITFLVPPPPIPMAGDDPEGHGTFVAGLIAGNGAQSPNGTNVFGSESNAVFRGIAPKTKLLALPLDTGASTNSAEVSEFNADSWLIETAARTNYLTLKRTNSLISNNSWTYGRAEYDSAAARYDAAVRDALPGATGSQPLLFVFAAGNGGFGAENGTGAQPDTIETPGTAKNVITVGALETARFIQASYTNKIVTTNEDGTTTTNDDVQFPFIGLTDSGNEVAAFSSRGNVGIGIESDFGRFKPDVVAPGTMLISTRSKAWNFNGVDTNEPFGQTLFNLNTNLGPYRYDSGSTFAAANISGMLALIQEYFESQAPAPLRGTLSPALMKALLINGSRSLAQVYDVSVRGAVNDQGWGLPNLPNTLTSFTTNDHRNLDSKKWRLRMVEQSPTNALATGESRTWRVKLSSNAVVFPLRATLVWSDPPGNPAVGVKLVNDLDLVVTNLDTGLVYYGNNIPAGADFTDPVEPVEGQLLPVDSVNNVENVFIRDPKQLGSEFTITVSARRVNVNAVSDYFSRTGNTNDVVQDFALVVSSDMGADPAFNDPEDPAGYLPEQTVFDTFDAPTRFEVQPRPAFGIITNGLPLLQQRVGANATLVSTNGITNQWSFYVFTNIYISNSLVDIKNGSNVAFLIFDSPNLSTPRQEADLDLYVSKDSRLTNLHPAAISSALKSVEQGGTETVAMTNAAIGDIFYVAVKSEDQMAGEFSLIGVSSDQPFQEQRGNKIVLHGVPFSAWVPDGTSRRPTAGTMIAIGLSNDRVARATVNTIVEHEDLGDLVGLLSHKSIRSVLNNHLVTGLITNTLNYDDNNFYPLASGWRRSDGPGTLNDFAGTRLTGSWLLQQIDNAPGHTGRVDFLEILIDPLRKPLINSLTLLNETVNAGEIAFYPMEVPVNATNVTFKFSNVTGGPLDIFFRMNELPQTNLFDAKYTLGASTPGNFVFPRTTNDPPLIPGTHFLAVRNTGNAQAKYDLQVVFLFRKDGANEFSRTNSGLALPDDAATNQVIDVPADKLIAKVQVSVNMPHPRSSDTVLTLTTPQGTRVMLDEQRGGTNAFGLGSSFLTTNITAAATNITTNLTYTVFTDDTNLTTTPIKFANLNNTAGLGGVPLLRNGFEGATNGNYGVGRSISGWDVIVSSNKSGTAPDQVSILTGPALAESGTNVISLGTAAIRRGIPTVLGRAYKLRVAMRAAPVLDLFSTGLDDARKPLAAGEADPHYQYLSTDFPGSNGLEAFVLGTNNKAFRAPANWTRSSTNSQWIAPFLNQTGSAEASVYTLRTYVDLHEQNPALFVANVRWASDSFASDILLNGISQKATSGNANAFATAPVKPLGAFVNGLNIIDFVVKDSSELAGIRVESAGLNITNKLENPQMDVVVGNRAVAVTAGTGWSIYTLDFIGDGKTNFVQFHSRSGEVWVDSVSVEATGNIFVMPEEPLDLLSGERAVGEWRLDLRDARTGAVLPANGMTWKLDLNFADPVLSADRLYNGAFYPQSYLSELFPLANPTNRLFPGVLYTNQVHYFIIEPCTAAQSLNVVLVGMTNFDGIELLADRSGIPTANPDTDDYVILRNNENPGRPNGIATFHIDRSRPAGAPYVGKRVFLAVRNRFIESTNRYTLFVRFAGGAGCAVPPPPLLAKDVTESGFLMAASPEFSGEEEGNVYQVNVASGAQSISISAAGDGDLALVAQKNSPPTRDAFSHSQNTANSGNETLTITSASGVPLSSGTWYVRVLNNSPFPVSYDITATGDIGAGGGGPAPEISAALVGGAIQLSWTSTAGTTYGIQASDDLETWTFAGTVTAAGSVTTFTPPAGSGSAQFYRIVQN